MKKIKLLTSIAALALILGLGACEINGDINIGIGGDTDTTDTESEEPSTGNTDDDGDGENTPSQPSEEELLQKELEEFQEVLKGLGDDPFSGWKAYKYTLDETTKLIKEGDDGYPFGYYRLAEDEVSYFVDGQNYYSGYDGSYETSELTETYQDQLKEDVSFFSLETLLSLTSDNVLSLTQEDDAYSISYQFVKEGVLTGTTTSTYKLGLTISEDKLVKATCDYLEVFEAGSYGTDSEEEKSESIEKVDPETITLDLLIEEGFNSDLWVKETEPVLLGVFDWTGATDGNTSNNQTIACTQPQMQTTLENHWTPEAGYESLSFTVTSTDHMRYGSNNNASYYWPLSGSLECITFGNDNAAGHLTIEFDETIEITSIDFVLCVNGGTARTDGFTVNDESQTPLKYNQIDGYATQTTWDGTPVTTFESFTPSNVLEMTGLSSSNGDRVAVHSMAIYGRKVSTSGSTTEPEEEVEEELPNYTVTFSFSEPTDEGEEKVYWTKTVFTEDALVTEYYTDYEELLGNGEYSYQDKEVFLNTEEGCDIFMCWDWYQEDLYYQETKEGTYVDFFGGSIFDLREYESNFVEGETASTDRGSETSYTINNLSDSDFTDTLLRRLFDYYFKSYELCYGYDSSLAGFDDLLAAGESLEYSLVYIAEIETYEFIFSEGTYTYTAYLYDIGTSESTVDSLNLIYDYE